MSDRQKIYEPARHITTADRPQVDVPSMSAIDLYGPLVDVMRHLPTIMKLSANVKTLDELVAEAREEDAY